MWINYSSIIFNAVCARRDTMRCRLVNFALSAPYKYSYLLTYLLTYLSGKAVELLLHHWKVMPDLLLMLRQFGDNDVACTVCMNAMWSLCATGMIAMDTISCF